MKISVITANNYPTDREIRTKKIIKTLTDEGHEVQIIARNTPKDPSRGEIASSPDHHIEQLETGLVRRFPKDPRSKVQQLMSIPIPYNPVWIIWIYLSLIKNNTDVVIACDLRAGSYGSIAAKLARTQLIIDLRENHSEFVKYMPKNGLLDHILKSPWIIKQLERSVLVTADCVWVVVKERIPDLPKGVSQVKVVRNTPVLQISKGNEEYNPNTGHEYSENQLTLIYVGLLNEYRGIDKMIKTISVLDENGIEVHLLIGGEGEYRDDLEQQASDLGVDDLVHFAGWVDSDQIPNFIGEGDVGIIPHHVDDFTDTTVPNKLFDYMSSGIPVLSSNMTPVQRIIDEHDCGKVFEDDAPIEMIADQILQLKQECNLDSMGENGKNAVEEKYNWEHDSNQIQNTLKELGN